MGTWSTESGVVCFPNGYRIRGTGRSRGTAPNPDYAVYLLAHDPLVQEWPYQWVPWRDFLLPGSTSDAVAVLQDAWRRCPNQRVEIACGGGIGRTGTALALLATYSGIEPNEAVAWVRSNYHPRAVETWWQRRWVIKTA